VAQLTPLAGIWFILLLCLSLMVVASDLPVANKSR